jgi:hypothetical protein
MCGRAEVYKVTNKIRVGFYRNPNFASMVEAVVNGKPSENEVAVYGRNAGGSSVNEIMTKHAQLLKPICE